MESPIQKLSIITEPEEEPNELSKTKWIKEISGNDRYEERKLYKKEYEPMFSLPPPIFPFSTQSIYEPICCNSRQSYEIKKSVWFGDNEEDEYARVFKQFEDSFAQNALDVGGQEYLVIFDYNRRCFYLKNITTSKLYCCDYGDIRIIYFQSYGTNLLFEPVKTENGSYNFYPDNFDGQKLDIKLFKMFILCDFEFINTIMCLK